MILQLDLGVDALPGGLRWSGVLLSFRELDIYGRGLTSRKGASYGKAERRRCLNA